jgi:hypothetical protein
MSDVALDDHTVLNDLLFPCRSIKNCTGVAVTVFFPSAVWNNKVKRLFIRKDVSQE